MQQQHQQQIPVSGQNVYTPNLGPMVMQQPVTSMRVKVKATIGLSITQLVLGSLSTVCGLVVLINDKGMSAYNAYGISGMLCGAWVAFTGVVGICSSRHPTSTSLNGTNIGFNVVACMISFCKVTAGILIALINHSCRSDFFYGDLDRICQRFNVNFSLTWCIVSFFIVEFIVSLSASILCCTYGCGRNGCCAQNQPIYVYQQPNQSPQYIVSSSAGSTVVPSAYPVQSSQMYHPNQPMVLQANYNQPGATNVTYSSEQPPQYQEKQTPVVA